MVAGGNLKELLSKPNWIMNPDVVVLITCMFSFMDRLADGLGVELPTGRQEAIEQWLTGPATQQDWLMRARS